MKVIKFKQLGVILFFLVTSRLLFSQSGSATVVYAEGDGFTVVRDGASSFYEVDYDDILGMLLYGGDTILTEEDTFLELQVTSNASLIKIAENTTFSFESIGDSGGGILNVAYGRIRAKINKMTNDDYFRISGTDTVAGVRGTDFGYDLTFGEDLSVNESNEIITTVYCFEGSVQVEQSNFKTNEIKEVLIGADQMVVTSSEKQEAPFFVYDIKEEIEQFWKENRFVYELTDEPVLVVSQDYKAEKYYSDKIFGEKRKMRRAGGTFIVSSMLLAVGGLVTYDLIEEKDLSVGLLTLGGVSFVAGILFSAQSAILPEEAFFSSALLPDEG